MDDKKNSALILNQQNHEEFFDSDYSNNIKDTINILNQATGLKNTSTDRLIELSDEGRLIVVSDIHGNLNDYSNYLKLWDENDSNFHIVFLGDLIHAQDFEDSSVEILDDAIEKSKKYSNFHCLMGNHELSHITNKNIYKNGKNLLKDFKNLISYKKGYIEPALTNYIKFFKTLPLFVKTQNGVFISHAGPSNSIKSQKEFNNFLKDVDFHSKTLNEFLWNRYGNFYQTYARTGDYTENDVHDFLKIVKSNVMVVGHTPIKYDGYNIFGQQMILSSSFATYNKKYLDIDLSKKIESMDDLIDCLKQLN